MHRISRLLAAALLPLGVLGFVFLAPASPASASATNFTLVQQGPTTFETGQYVTEQFAVTGPNCNASPSNWAIVSVTPEDQGSFHGAYPLQMIFQACDTYLPVTFELENVGPWNFDFKDSTGNLLQVLTLTATPQLPDPLTVADTNPSGNFTVQPGQTDAVAYTLNSSASGRCYAFPDLFARITLSAPAGVTLSTTSVTFLGCGAALAHNVDVSAASPGDYTVTATLSQAFWAPSAYDLTQSSFTLHVVNPAPADTTPPVLPSLPDIALNATSASGAAASYGPATANDLVDGPVPVSFSVPSGNTFALGTTTVTYSATDAHGNTATSSFKVKVMVPWGGILQPVNADGSSSFKLGSTVPLKFAGFPGLSPTLTVTKSDSTPDGTDLEAVNSSPADTGNVFRYDSASGQYIFNLGTKLMSVGDWYAHVNLGDGIDHVVKFSLRK